MAPSLAVRLSSWYYTDVLVIGRQLVEGKILSAYCKLLRVQNRLHVESSNRYAYGVDRFRQFAGVVVNATYSNVTITGRPVDFLSKSTFPHPCKVYASPEAVLTMSLQGPKSYNPAADAVGYGGSVTVVIVVTFGSSQETV